MDAKNKLLEFLNKNKLWIILILTLFISGYFLFKPKSTVLSDTKSPVLEYQYKELEKQLAEANKKLLESEKSFQDSKKEWEASKTKNKEIVIKYEKELHYIDNLSADDNFKLFSKWVSKADSSR